MDGLPLLKENNSLRCDKGHVFDFAREGYCNLLLVQQKASLDPGDKKDTVAARRRFLDTGFFLPIAECMFKIISEIVQKSEKKEALRIVDAGCGEGYYLHQLGKLAAASHGPAKLEMAGCDISKWAIKAAAKRSTDIAWAVAGNKRLPFAPGSVDIILSLFGFPVWESFKEIQAAGGHAVLVDPGPEHIIELRKIIYPSVHTGAPPLLTKAVKSGYVLEHEEPLKFSVSLENNAVIQDLLAMTPHIFRITKKAREDIQEVKQLTVSADVVFRILRKAG